MSRSIEDFTERVQFMESHKRGLKVNFNKTKLMLSGTEGERSRTKIDPCGMSGKESDD